MVKNLPVMQETWVRSLSQEDPLKKEWQPTPVFLPGEFHGQRSLAGYIPLGCKELDTTEWLSLTHSLTHSLLLHGLEALELLTQASAHLLWIFCLTLEPTKILCLDYFFFQETWANRYSDFSASRSFKQQIIYKLVETQWVWFYSTHLIFCITNVLIVGKIRSVNIWDTFPSSEIETQSS